MRVLIIILLFIGSGVYAQTNEKKGTIKVKKVKTETKDTIMYQPISVSAPLTVVDYMPEFSGGTNEMMKFIQKNIKYPEAEKRAKISGTCYVTFIVENDGTLSNVRILKGVLNGPGCDTEATRVVNLMPKWIPGKQNGVVVKVAYTLPIKFKLN